MFKEDKTMTYMSTEDWPVFKDRAMGSVENVLSSDLEQLRRMDVSKRSELWSQIEVSQEIFEAEYVSKLPKDIMLDSRGKFAFARLLLAAVTHMNDENNPIVSNFSEKELVLVENFERFNVFDILTTQEIVEQISVHLKQHGVPTTIDIGDEQLKLQQNAQSSDLQRLRRQFIHMNRLHQVTSDKISTLFIQYLQNNLK